jgi:hypothetical protein
MPLVKLALFAATVAGILLAQTDAPPHVEAMLLKDKDANGRKDVCFSIETTSQSVNGLIIYAYFTQLASGYIELTGVNGKHRESFENEDSPQLQTDSDAGFYTLTLVLSAPAHIKTLTARAYRGNSIRERSCSDAKKK